MGPIRELEYSPRRRGIKPTPYPLQLGGNPNFSAAADEEPFSGQIDEARCSGRVLTAAEIKALYDARYGSLLPPSIGRTRRRPALCRRTARFSSRPSAARRFPIMEDQRHRDYRGLEQHAGPGGVTTALNGVNVTVTVANRPIP
jgi:hypothetical protein